MKIRKSFVSNSSSSSFICKTCGKYTEAFDPIPLEIGYVVCSDFGHTFCREHIASDLALSDWGSFDSKECPVCNMQILTDSDLISLGTECLGFSRNEALTFLQEHFDSYDDFDSQIPPYDGVENDIKYCEACLGGYASYEAGFIESDFVDCPRGHHVCKEHLETEGCPICNRTRISNHDYIRLFLWVNGFSRQDLLDYMESKFHVYANFHAFCKMRKEQRMRESLNGVRSKE